MKKVMKRLAVLAIGATMALQMSFFVSAASVGVTSWTANGNNMQAVVVNNYTAVTRTVVVTDYVMHHMPGLATPFIPGSHQVTTERTASPSFPTEYSTYLNSAAEKVSMPASFDKTVTFTNTITIPTTNAMGLYSPTTTVTGYAGEYRVELIGASSTSVVSSGTITFAPISCTGIYTGVRRVRQ